MNRTVLFCKVAVIHLLVLGFFFVLINGCERKRQEEYSPPPVVASSSMEERKEIVGKGGPAAIKEKEEIIEEEKPSAVKATEEIIEKEEPLLIKEYGEPGAVKASEISGDVKEGAEERIHEIKKGETLSGIAKDYGISLKAILAINDIKDPGKIMVGQKIRIPGDS